MDKTIEIVNKEFDAETGDIEIEQISISEPATKTITLTNLRKELQETQDERDIWLDRMNARILEKQNEITEIEIALNIKE